ncbi:MAG TPA: alpha-L-arabinofuranosidase C-terminal domain-containing protein [Verrucomicrobiae bacterium]|jgi:alpha-N-arabinofuranosidase
MRLRFFCLAAAIVAAGFGLHAAEPIVIEATPMQAGAIDPMLFGNFVELLDDVVPGMWAEMLNDRSFAGVIPAANWSYFDGKPDFCDRTWEASPSWSIETNNPFNGARCARLAPAVAQSGLAVKKDMEYEFSGYFRSDAGAKARVVLKALLPDGSWMTLASAKLPAATPGWKKYSVRLRSRGLTDRAVFELRAEGKGSLWAGKLSLMPADNLDGWRRDVVEAVRDVHPGVIRWGGSSCDPGQYRWKNGIGDRDLRAPFRNEIWGRIDSNDVGVDEFCRFCERVGAEPLICLSFSDGAESARDLVEYCNGPADSQWGARRAAGGHPAPYRVKYWQAGNEIDGNDARYLSQFGDFARLMKQADSGVQLLTSFPSQKLLAGYGKDIFCVCPHHYTTDLAWCDQDLAGISKMIDSTPGCENVKIGVTEWNTSAGDWGLGRGRQMTLGAALANARYLHVLMRHSDKAKIACRSNMANSYCGAIIETDPAGVLKRPSYWVMQLYTRHAQPIPLRCTQPEGGLDTFACASRDGKLLTVFCVNTRNEPAACSFKPQGSFAAMRVAAAEAVCDSRDARQPDVVNHWEAPERVKIVPVPFSTDGVMLPALSATAVSMGRQGDFSRRPE